MYPRINFKIVNIKRDNNDISGIFILTSPNYRQIKLKIFTSFFIIAFLLSYFSFFNQQIYAIDIAAVTPVPLALEENPLLGYEIDINSDSVLVIETGRAMKLLMKNQEKPAQIPMASKIMTALITAEKYAKNLRDARTTMVTISSVAAEQKDAYVLSLRAGEKYSLEYLLYGLIMKDNNAAAVALAEHVSGTVDDFVLLMNEKASTYQMVNTIFKNPTGLPVKDQVVTVADLAMLFRYALSNESFDAILKTKDTIIFPSGSGSSKHLFSDASQIWSLTENATGMIVSNTSEGMAYALTAKHGQFGIFVVGTSLQKNVTDDISKILDSIYSDFEYSILVRPSMSFPQDMTVGQETFSLKFGTNPIYYVHPTNTDFIADTNYVPNSNISFPIKTSISVATVTFILYDGTKITANLYPNVDIWSESSLYQKMYDLYLSNKNIMNLIFALTLLFIAIGLSRLIYQVYFSLSKRLKKD